MRLLLLLFIVTGTSTFAQKSSIDSLINLLPTQSDTLKIITLNNIAHKYLAFEPFKAEQYANEALELSQVRNYARGQVYSILNLGDFEFRQSNYAKSLELGTQAIKVAMKLGDSSLIADGYRLMGNVHTFGFRQYDEALRYHIKALKIIEKGKDKQKLAALYGSITWVYSVTNQNLAEAVQLANEGIRIGQSLNDHQMISYNLNSLGLISYRQKKYDSALYFLKQSNQEAERVNDEAVKTVNSLTIANIHLAQQQIDKAILLFHQVAKDGKAINLREIQKDAFEGLSKSYFAQRNFEQAFQYQTRFILLRDSLLNWEITQKSMALKAGFDAERQEIKITELELENERAKLERNVSILVFVLVTLLLLSIGLLVVRNNRQKRIANQQLQEKNQEIQTQNVELIKSREELLRQSDLVNEKNASLQQANEMKDKLFSIISHDLRGPIASLKSLLGLVAKGAVNVDEFQVMAPKLNQNVTGIHETLENLLQWSYSQMRGVKFSPVVFDLKKVIENKVNLFLEAAKAKRITIADKTPSEIFAFADQDQVSLILRNLLNNAIKFTPDGGRVTMAAEHVGDQISITITDTGIGIPPDRLAELFKPLARASTVGTHGEKGTGLGLLLCYEMAQKNNGQLLVKSQVGVGSTFTLLLPMPARAAD